MSAPEPSLWVVMPVHNEAAAIESVIGEWLPVLRATVPNFVLLVINDGSTDGTDVILDRLASKYPELRVRHRSNAGHGPSCHFGYRTALEQGAGWILQLDSDGQCDPAWFLALWRARDDASAILGRRVWRDDGIARWGVSRVVSLVVWLHTGRWLRDANVPYRLIRADALKVALQEVPPEAFFCNILLAVQLQRRHPIQWVPIRFRRRTAGQSTLRMSSLVQFARRLSSELRALPALEVKG